ncbi:FAD:protein FMN transferase [Microbacterium gorillae]|uniref:FAD:protein FMN transferase n=1 Tax=Microbacterium gorillae TaxID=1231063 RepID=UPI00058FA16D|nr:FAD:protein FMN transferase [Microbacterium gorillae]
MPSPAEWAFPAIGTSWRVSTVEPLSVLVRDAVAAEIETFDRAWSRFRPDSAVSRLAEQAGTATAPAAGLLREVYDEVDTATGGAVNPLVGGSLTALGYDAEMSLRAGDPTPAPADWRGTFRAEGDTVTMTRPGLLDIGACGKGLLVDRVSAVLTAHGVSTHVVDASGDLILRGTSERIALEHPYDPTRAIGVVTVSEAALCASATNRRAWGEGLHHVLDARTGMPVRTVVATWAVHPDALHADALATALFFDGGPALAARWGGDWVRMFTDGRAEYGPHTTFEVFT